MNIFKYYNLTDEKIQEWQNEIKSIKQQYKKLKKENKNIKKGYKSLISNIDMDKDVFKFYNSYMEDMEILGNPQFETLGSFNLTNTQKI